MINVSHALAPVEAKACVTCGEGTSWRVMIEPVVGLQITKPLCEHCTLAIGRVGSILSRARQAWRVLRAENPPK